MICGGKDLLHVCCCMYVAAVCHLRLRLHAARMYVCMLAVYGCRSDKNGMRASVNDSLSRFAAFD